MRACNVMLALLATASQLHLHISLRRLVRALELHCSEIVGALSEQLCLGSITEGMTQLAVGACACDISRYDILCRSGLMPSDDDGLVAILDLSTLRVPSEANVYDLIRHHIITVNPSADVQQAIWATCRFTPLPADRLITLAELPNVPPRWLALACAQRAATVASGSSTDGMAAENSLSKAELGRLQPREFYA